jgi:predicted small secreted protein
MKYLLAILALVVVVSVLTGCGNTTPDLSDDAGVDTGKDTVSDASTAEVEQIMGEEMIAEDEYVELGEMI